MAVAAGEEEDHLVAGEVDMGVEALIEGMIGVDMLLGVEAIAEAIEADREDTLRTNMP